MIYDTIHVIWERYGKLNPPSTSPHCKSSVLDKGKLDRTDVNCRYVIGRQAEEELKCVSSAQVMIWEGGRELQSQWWPFSCFPGGGMHEWSSANAPHPAVTVIDWRCDPCVVIGRKILLLLLSTIISTSTLQSLFVCVTDRPNERTFASLCHTDSAL